MYDFGERKCLPYPTLCLGWLFNWCVPHVNESLRCLTDAILRRTFAHLFTPRAALLFQGYHEPPTTDGGGEWVREGEGGNAMQQLRLKWFIAYIQYAYIQPICIQLHFHEIKIHHPSPDHLSLLLLLPSDGSTSSFQWPIIWTKFVQPILIIDMEQSSESRFLPFTN